MIPYSEALAKADALAKGFRREQVSVWSACDRYLTSAIHAPFDLPPFSRSAMDGFAVRKADIETLPGEQWLDIAESVAAGTLPRKEAVPGTAIQIMTGAALPAGADWVVRVEFAEVEGGRVRFTQQEKGSNVIRAGENGKSGDLMVSPRRLGVHDVGTIASLGIDTVEVMAQPKLGIISTGDEVREPGERIAPGEIFNSNAVQLSAHARRAGFLPTYYGISQDTEDSLLSHIEPALAENDFLVLSGGVSKGEFDYVPAVLADCGVETVFHRVAMKPGRPTLLGYRDNGPSGRKYVLGLPGNPVSTYVTFEVFGLRMLYLLAGLMPPENRLQVILGETVRKGDPERTEFVPVAIREGVAHRVPYFGSSHLNALSQADALLQLEVGVTQIEGGTNVAVRPL